MARAANKQPTRSRAKAVPAASRTNDPERTRADILEVATHEFAEKGLSGARIDEIAERTRTSKRMIYYYFDGKEGLYRAVLEAAYSRVRATETGLHLEEKPPLEALADLVRFTFDHHMANPDFIRLVMVENIHHGENIEALSNIRAVNRPVIDNIRRICERGVEAGVIRADIEPIDVHMSISALCFFNVSNRHTFSRIFGVDMTSPEPVERRRQQVVRMLLRYVMP